MFAWKHRDSMLDVVVTQRKNSLGSLPLDILVVVLSFVDATDLIRVCQCCKSLQRASSIRTTWINAYKNVLQEQCLFDTLSLKEFSIPDLKCAALSPILFSNWICSIQPNPLYPLRAQRVSILAPLDLPPPHDNNVNETGLPRDYVFQTLVLVPGGQYLFTFSGCFVHLWHLGKTPRDLMPSEPVAILELDEPVDYEHQPLMMREGDDLILMLSTWSEQPMIHFLKCDLKTASIQPQATLPVDLGKYEQLSWSGIGLTGVLLVIPISGDITVWSFWDNKSLTIECGKQCSKALACTDENKVDDYIVSLNDLEFCVYKLPELHNAAERFSISISPSLRIVVPYRKPLFAEPTGWYNHLSPPDGRGMFMLDIVGKDDNNHQVISRYTFLDMQTSHDTVCSILPHSLDSLSDNENDITIVNITSYDLANGNRAFLCIDSVQSLLCKVTCSTDGDNWGAKPMKSLWTWPPNSGPKVFSLCPLSGRLCVLVNGEVRVMDFVSVLR